MKIIMLFISIVVCCLQSVDLKDVRRAYKIAAQEQSQLIVYNKMLQHVTKNDKIELVAYKGAGIALKGRFAKKIKDKREFFIKGVTLLEYTISKSENNIELRFIRLGIQENAPKLLKYKKNIQEDKSYILSHYRTITSADLKQHIKDYISQSKVFTSEEKMLVQ